MTRPGHPDMTIHLSSTPNNIILHLGSDAETTTVALDAISAMHLGMQLISTAQQVSPQHDIPATSVDAHDPTPAATTPPPRQTVGPTPATMPQRTTPPPDAASTPEPATEPPVSIPPAYRSLLADEDIDWHITHSARTRADQLGITDEQMTAAAAAPERVDTMTDGITRGYVRDGVSVLVPDNDPTSIIGVREDWATAHGSASDKRRGASTGPGRRMPDDTAALKRQLRDHGFTVGLTNGDHLYITHPDHPGTTYTSSQTASDWRSIRNMIAELRQQFGIDITISE